MKITNFEAYKYWVIFIFLSIRIMIIITKIMDKG